jgi:galactonate dehydratase
VTLTLRTRTLHDPDGHSPALALRGDWLIVEVGDGAHVGRGEASHSGDDGACLSRVEELFDAHVRGVEPIPEAITWLEEGDFSEAAELRTATAISALDQALWELAARREGVPVWRLFACEPLRRSVPVYVTVNRALASRDDADYRDAVGRAVELGVTRVKVAPFEAVTGAGDPLVAARRGVAVLRMLRETYPGVGLRVDLHERFRPDDALALLTQLLPLGLDWIEAPCPAGPVYAEIRRRAGVPLAAGELSFGTADYVELASRGWVDVVMPDVKHVGGFGPLLRVCDAVRPFGVRVSPHNPSGIVSTAASLHAAALAEGATEIELALPGRGREAPWRPLLSGGRLHLPPGPGWGVTPGDVEEAGAGGPLA